MTTATKLPPTWMRPRAQRMGTPQLEAIIEAVAAHYGVAVADIKRHTKPSPIAWARHVAMVMCSRLTGLADGQIAAVLQHERSTMSHARQRVRETCEAYPEIARELEALETKLRKEIE